jgi:CRISPR/Cas system CSM-associated protein Csm3 (group 7 of RAMP superfamily)
MTPMPETAILRLDILDWWHCSAGHGVRSGANARVLRDGMLPYVPGRTVKGLLRDALRQAELFSHTHRSAGAAAPVPEDTTNLLLGLPTNIVLSDAAALAGYRFATRRAWLRVGSATLPEAWRRWAATRQGEEALRDVTETLHRTAIDVAGQAERSSLRTIEVMPPMTLEAVLSYHNDSDPWAAQGGWRGVVRAALPLLRGLGAGRTRGLGRVAATLCDGDATEASL